MFHEVRRIATITKGDLPQYTELLEVFDKITFNTDGEIMATLETNLPLFGGVTISYYARENHIAVYNTKAGADSEFIISEVYAPSWQPESREELESWVKSVIKQQLAEF